MSDILKRESVNIPNDAPMVVKNVYKANNGIPILHIKDKNQVVSGIHTSINQCVADSGINMPVDDINYVKTRVTDDIMANFKMLTLEEVNLAFYMGIRGDFGEYYGLNTITFYNWLKAYRNDLLPKILNNIQNYVKVPQIEHKPNKLEQYRTWKAIIENLSKFYDRYQKEGVYDFIDFGGINYSFIKNDLGLVEFTEDDLNLINERAKQSFTDEIHKKNNDLRKQGREVQRVDIQFALEQLEIGRSDFKSKYDVLVDKQSLKLFLDKCIEQNINLQELMNTTFANKLPELSKKP